MKSPSDQNYFCRDMVRDKDRARYDVSLFAPARVRPALWALYAFNQEVAKTRESVSEPALGEIRLQWWQDVIEELKAGHQREHPVVADMAQYLHSSAIQTLMTEIITARQVDMYADGPADFDALASYARSVGGALSEAALLLSLEDHPGDVLIDAARASGSAWAMLGLVRAIPFHWASNRNFVPGDEGKAALATTDADKMYALAAPSIAEMVAYATSENERSQKLLKGTPKSIRYSFLLNALSDLYMRNLKKVGGNPFQYREPSDFRRMWALLVASIFD